MDELSIYFDFLDSQKLSRLTLAEDLTDDQLMKYHHFASLKRVSSKANPNLTTTIQDVGNTEECGEVGGQEAQQEQLTQPNWLYCNPEGHSKWIILRFKLTEPFIKLSTYEENTDLKALSNDENTDLKALSNDENTDLKALSNDENTALSANQQVKPPGKKIPKAKLKPNSQLDEIIGVCLNYCHECADEDNHQYFFSQLKSCAREMALVLDKVFPLEERIHSDHRQAMADCFVNAYPLMEERYHYFVHIMGIKQDKSKKTKAEIFPTLVSYISRRLYHELNKDGMIHKEKQKLKIKVSTAMKKRNEQARKRKLEQIENEELADQCDFDQRISSPPNPDDLEDDSLQEATESPHRDDQMGDRLQVASVSPPNLDDLEDDSLQFESPHRDYQVNSSSFGKVNDSKSSNAKPLHKPKPKVLSKPKPKTLPKINSVSTRKSSRKTRSASNRKT